MEHDRPHDRKDAVARQYAAELTAMARDVIATNRYFVLGTAHPDGQPRVSPVYFNHHEHRSFYWVSSPESQHSRNIAADPRLNAVVFDSSTPPPANRAVVPDRHGRRGAGGRPRGRDPTRLRPGRQGRPRVHGRRSCAAHGDLRLYRLDVTTAEVHARGGHPLWGQGIDTRLPVTLR